MDAQTVKVAFKTKIHLNNKQRSAFSKWSRARRRAYNYGLSLCRVYLDECERTGQPNKLLTMIDVFDKWFNATKYPLGYVRKGKGGGLIGTGGNEWIRMIPSSACQIAIKYDLKEAWKRCFQGLGQAPKFQGRYRRDSFRLSNVDVKSSDIRGSLLVLPKDLGTVRLGDQIPYSEFKLGNTAISRRGDKWYVSFCLTVPASEYYKQSDVRDEIIGVDLGVAIYAATSAGENYYAPKKLKRLESRKDRINRIIGKTLHKNLMLVVRRCERCVSRVKGVGDKKRLCKVCRENFKPLMVSRKLRKLRASLARIDSKMVAIRENMAHQLTTGLVKRYDMIAIEDLQVKNMTASAKGDSDKPGKNVKQKAGLNRSFLAVSPGLFRSQLEYKAAKYGASVVAVPPQYTSQTCPACGYLSSENRKTQSQFLCVECGYAGNADTTAAINIRERAREGPEQR